MSIYDFKANLNDGTEIALNEYKGKVLLIVNTASACGFTPQYEELQDLYHRFKNDGFEVLAFPCNQFGKQERGDNSQIKEFCDLKFNIKFPLFEKIEVNGDNAHPLYQHMKTAQPGILGTEKIKWNFTKFLIDREGNVVERFAPKDKPLDLIPKIKKYL